MFKRNLQKNTRWKKSRWVLVLLGIFVLIGLMWESSKQVAKNGTLQELQQERGYIRTVEQEEYDFFRNLVLRDVGEHLTEEELDVKTREKINRTNAEFLLGNKMGLCGPYSFESFQRDMENENTQRRLKKKKNEVFYGPEQFDLTTYYIYVTGNLKLDMVSFITQNADEEVLKGAKKYFKDHKENYRTIEKIEYLLTENGVIKNMILYREEMSTLEKTDAELFGFLYEGSTDDELKYIYQNIDRTIKIKSVEYEKLTYQNNIEKVVRDYITNIYLENWLLMIGKEYPVEFNL